MSRFTVFGAAGFIGSSLLKYLSERGHEVLPVTREKWPAPATDLGHAIYAIGLTADFRSRRLDIVEAHAHLLTRILRENRFDSLLYLSSTRIYSGGTSSAEDSNFTVSPMNEDHLYNVSKIMGESLVLSDKNARARVVRLSNVIGTKDRSDNFLNSVILEAATGDEVLFGTAPESERDFIDVADACAMIEAVASRGQRRIYNVASGKNISNVEIARLLGIRNVKILFQPGATKITYPAISTSAIRQEFGFSPIPFEKSFDEIWANRNTSKKSIDQ